MYRPDRVLYVDAACAPQAQANIRGLLKAFRKVAETEIFDYRQEAQRHGAEAMNEQLVHFAAKFKPDLVHLGKCESVRGEAIRRIKDATGACVLHFYGDPRWEVQSWVADIGRYADWTLLYHEDAGLIKAHLDAGCRRVGYWWYGVDPEVFYPRKVTKEYDVMFAANVPSRKLRLDRDERLALIRASAAAGHGTHVFGEGWREIAGTPGVRLHPFTDLDELAVAYSRTKVTLGHGIHVWRMYTSWRRVFGAMACGTFFLVRHFPGLETVFGNGKHLVWFDSIPEAVELIGHYLAADRERERIAAAGCEEVLAHHTWDHRVAELLDYIQ